MSARLVVTGLGLVTALGRGVEPTWRRLLRGDRGIAPARGFDATGQRVDLAAEAPSLELAGPGWSRTSGLALAAIEEAMGQAALDVRAGRVGLVVATTTGGMLETEALLAEVHRDPDANVWSQMLSHPLSVTAERLDERRGPFARMRTVSSACSSGAMAVVLAAAWLRADEADAVVVCGADALCRLTLSGFNALAALDREPCRPFDAGRRGTTLGEGAGALVLEGADRARGRGAPLLAELVGWAAGSEAHHVTQPAPDGALVERLVRRVLGRAALLPADVDYVSAHGTGTPVGDPIEAAALARALGGEIARIPVSSHKGQIGHTLGAAGALEAVLTVMAVARGAVPPTAGLREPDPAIGLVHVRDVGRSVPVRSALSCALGFGGMDAVLGFARPGVTREPVVPSRRRVVVTGVAVGGAFGVVSGRECADLGEGWSRPAAVDPAAHLDPDRSRRLDAGARLAVAVVERALGDAGAPANGTGLVLGSAFGCVDGSAAFMHRVFSRGPRSAPPAEFPGLVPSAHVGHASIYLGLTGPGFSVADLATSGPSGALEAVTLVATGEAPRIAAGAVEPRSLIAERGLGALFGSAAAGERRDLAAVLVFEGEDEARSRGARVLAVVQQALERRGCGPSPWAALRSPIEGAEVVVAPGEETALSSLEGTPWRTVPRVALSRALGPSDACGAAALAFAAGRIARGEAPEILCLGASPGHVVALLLSAP